MTAQVMPVEDGLDALGKEILASGRTYSVFDLAKLVLGARERFNVGFRCSGEQRLFRCRKDGAVWLTKSEALKHFWASDLRHDYYEEVATSADPPRGNFQAVAKCGLSGEYLGPPNYHGYQVALMQMHRERFGHMSLEAYKRKIRMVRDEEAVNAWLEKMSKRVQFRPTGGVKKEEVKETAAAEVPADDQAAESGDPEAPTTTEETVAAPDAAAAETDAPTPEAESDEVAAGGEAEPAGDGHTEGDEPAADDAPAEPDPGTGEDDEEEPAAPELLLNDHQQVERHFLDHHFAEVYHMTDRAWVSGNIPGNHISPGLLTLLRQVVAEERRYPGKLTPMLCRQLSGRHVAVFKWRKKLKAGPSRPHGVPDDIILADRPTALLAWLKANSGKNLEALWKDMLTDGADEDTKHLWYHDLHWILNQGYGILLSDSTLHLAKREDAPRGGGKGKQAGAAKGKKPGAKPGAKPGQEAGAAEEPKEAETPKSKAAPITVTALRGSVGLYALTGTNLAGAPKSYQAFAGRGLWPLPSRLDNDEIEDEEKDKKDKLFGL